VISLSRFQFPRARSPIVRTFFLLYCSAAGGIQRQRGKFTSGFYSHNNADEAFFASFIMLRIGALVKAGMDPFPVSNDFTLLVRQAPIIQLLTAANSLGIT
jgi:hypothetical protein